MHGFQHVGPHKARAAWQMLEFWHWLKGGKEIIYICSRSIRFLFRKRLWKMEMLLNEWVALLISQGTIVLAWRWPCCSTEGLIMDVTAPHSCSPFLQNVGNRAHLRRANDKNFTAKWTFDLLNQSQSENTSNYCMQIACSPPQINIHLMDTCLNMWARCTSLHMCGHVPTASTLWIFTPWNQTLALPNVPFTVEVWIVVIAARHVTYISLSLFSLSNSLLQKMALELGRSEEDVPALK